MEDGASGRVVGVVTDPSTKRLARSATPLSSPTLHAHALPPHLHANKAGAAAWLTGLCCASEMSVFYAV